MASLLSEIQFASLLVYAPQGTSTTSLKSKGVRSAIKRGDPEILALAAQRLAECREKWFAEFFTAETVLVPVPGSSPMRNPKSLWVARDYCRLLTARGLGLEMQACLSRTEAVPKSAYAQPQDRPKPTRHLDSLAVRGSLFPPRAITLVDDVVTRGATLLAAASRLQEAFPDCTVRAFAILRTMSRDEVETILAPCRGTITYSPHTDTARRDP